MKVVLIFLSFFLSLLGFSNSDRILAVSIQMGSHVSEVVGIAEKLDKYGHEKYLALSSKYDQTEAYEKKGFKILRYHVPEHQIIFSSPEGEKFLTDAVFNARKDLEFESQYAFPTWYRDCEYMMKDKQFIDTVKALNISLVVVDGLVLLLCNLILPAHLNIPFVMVSSMVSPLHVKIPGLPSFVPSLFTPYSDKMTLSERLMNSLTTLVMLNLPFKVSYDTSLLEEYAPQYNSWQEVVSKAMLTLQTRNYILEWPVPVMPHFIMLPGLGCCPNSSTLDPQYQALMNANNKGVIIMTFGSMFAKIPDEIVEKLLKAFAQIDQTVIWRLHLSTTKIHIPDNVKIKTWIPQPALLTHPNVKLFITHCGNGGQHEAVYNGVPMLGFPLFAEQPHNAHRIVDHGIGLKMNIHDFTPEEVVTNINRLMNEPSFSQNAKKVSAILRDRPMTSQEEAAYWVNHVIKFGGDHLKSHAIDMPWWKIFMLDILFIVFVLFSLVAFMIFVILKCCLKSLCPRSKEKLN